MSAGIPLAFPTLLLSTLDKTKTNNTATKVHFMALQRYWHEEHEGKNYYYYCVVIIFGDESFIKGLMYA